MDQTQRQDMFRGSSTLLYIPAFTTVKDFQSTISYNGNLHREGFLTTLGVPNSSLKQPPHNRGVGPQPNNQHLYLRGLQPPSSTSHKREQTQISTSTKEGANQQPTQPLPKREQPINEGFYNKWYITATNLSFPQNKDPKQIRIEDIAQVWNQGVFGKTNTKEKLLGNLLQMIEMKNQNNIPKTQFSLIFQNP